MQRCKEKQIKLNPGKLQFKLKQVKFMGEIITDKGVQPDPDKVRAILQLIITIGSWLIDLVFKYCQFGIHGQGGFCTLYMKVHIAHEAAQR